MVETLVTIQRTPASHPSQTKEDIRDKVSYLQQRAHDGDGIGHARSLHQNRVKGSVARIPFLSPLLHLVEDRGERPQQIAPHRAAHAAVIQKHHLRYGIYNDRK